MATFYHFGVVLGFTPIVLPIEVAVAVFLLHKPKFCIDTIFSNSIMFYLKTNLKANPPKKIFLYSNLESNPPMKIFLQ